MRARVSQDVHSRFRTEAHSDVVGRFNERFTLSLAGCAASCVMDDELNLLPLSSHLRTLNPILTAPGEGDEAQKDLKDLKASLKDTQPVGALVDRCRTLDQVRPAGACPLQSVPDWMPPGRRRPSSLFWTPFRRRASAALWLSPPPGAGGSLRL